jgi:ubiquinone/menaquinone biosynthesis C-methylase UbiE
MAMNLFARRDNPYQLVVAMAGIKMGDRFLQIGCAHGGRLAAVAGKVGLSGRAIVVVPDEAAATRAQKGAADAGVLVEVEVAPPSQLPVDAGDFDLALVDDTGGLLGTMRGPDRVATIRETLRVLRPGGRVMLVGALPRGGIGALLSRGQKGSASVDAAAAAAALQADGYGSVRTLAERDGLLFVEGIKPRGMTETAVIERR